MLATDNKVNKDIVELLLGNEANPNIQNKRGNTALFYAILDGNIEKVKLLLKFGADPYIKNKDNKTAFDYMKRLPNYLEMFKQIQWLI